MGRVGASFGGASGLIARPRLYETIIFKSLNYNILIGKYCALIVEPGMSAMNMLDLWQPDLDWFRLAGSMGGEGAKATILDRCTFA